MKDRKEQKTILVVDDDNVLAEVLASVLTEEGYKVSVLSDGGNVTQYIDEQNPHLVLLDYKLPFRDGVEILRDVRKSRSRYETPILVISASNNVQGIALEAGANGFFAKPFDLDKLLRTVNRQVRTEADVQTPQV